MSTVQVSAKWTGEALDFVEDHQSAKIPQRQHGFLQAREILRILQVETRHLPGVPVSDHSRKRGLPHLPRPADKNHFFFQIFENMGGDIAHMAILTQTPKQSRLFYNLLQNGQATKVRSI